MTTSSRASPASLPSSPADVSERADPFGFETLDLDWLRAKQGAKWHRHPGQLAAWVADMDFRPAPVVTDALHRFVDAGDLAYPDWKTPMAGTPVRDLFVDRCNRRYGWQIDAHDTREFVDVVQAVQVFLHVCTQPGDGVVVLMPSYPPLVHSVTGTGRRLIGHEIDGDSWDLDALDRRLAVEPARVLLLCHPHNPTGHAFRPSELQRLAAIAQAHDLLIISDEIHADLTYAPAVHRPIAMDAPDRTVTLHSASKAFNLAGMRYAVAHIGSASARERLHGLPDHLLGAVSVPAAVASHAAWSTGDEWLTEAMRHLDRNRWLLGDLLADYLPAVRYTPPEATYLAWLDCRALEMAAEPFEVFRAGGVQLSPGPDFGPQGTGFVRLNFATSSTILRDIVQHMASATQR